MGRKRRIYQNIKRKPTTIDVIPVMNGTKKWWESTTIQAILANGLTLALAAAKFEATGQETAAIIAGIMAVVGTFMGIRGRKKATKVIE